VGCGCGGAGAVVGVCSGAVVVVCCWVVVPCGSVDVEFCFLPVLVILGFAVVEDVLR
jgi:hypothetical protein